MKRFVKISILLIVVAVIAGVIWANTALESNTYFIHHKDIPEGFDGFVIAHVSDFHNKQKMAESTIDALKETQPDIICITGDLVDSHSTEIEIALAFVREAMKIAPCYYVTGNHEENLTEELQKGFLDRLAECGVVVLNDQEVILERNGSQISLAGHFWGGTDDVGDISSFDGYRILLNHQPETFKDVARSYDLVLAGHAHGGQFRIPFIGGLYAPGQGVLPEYDAGLFTEGGSNMLVSRGIGNSVFPLRFNNRPEVIFAVLKCLTPAS